MLDGQRVGASPRASCSALCSLRTRFLRGGPRPIRLPSILSARFAGNAWAPRGTRDAGSAGQTSMRHASVVAAWYFVNTALIITNKYLLTTLDFRYPITLTLLHMVACTLLTASATACGLILFQPLHSAQQLFKIGLLSTVFTATLVCGNISLSHIPVSFNQAVGACTPFFTAFFALVVQGRQESVATYATLVLVVGGVVMAARFEPSFHALGFGACLAATALRALKTVVQMVWNTVVANIPRSVEAALLVHPKEHLDSMNLLLRMAPAALIMLIPVSRVLEPGGFAAVQGAVSGDPGTRLALLCNAVFAFLANALNFLITQRTSALTLQVLGNVKSVGSALVGVLCFSNPFSVLGFVGFLCSVTGSALYGRARQRSLLAKKAS